MPDDSGFKRSLAIVALLHVGLLGVFFVTSRLGTRVPEKETIAWMDGSMGGGEATGEPDLQPAKNEAVPRETAPELISVPKPEPLPEPEVPPEVKPLASEIVTATPVPATPKPSTPKPTTPKPATPKPATPKPTPKATPKPTPKASPAATPKPKASPKPLAEEGDEVPAPKASPTAKAKATPGAKSTGGADAAAKLAFNKARGSGGGGASANGPGEGNGKGTAKTGDGEGTSQFGWYYSMIHDRFHARWEQPTNLDHNGVEVVTLLLLRIDKDGNVVGREIQKPSGFPQMDESVLSAAEKVRQIDPLPAGLGTNGVFEVSMKFRLDQQ